MVETTAMPVTLSNTCYQSCPEAALYLPQPSSTSGDICPAHCSPIKDNTSPCHSKIKILELEPPPEYSDCFIIGAKKIESVYCIGTCNSCDNQIDLFTGTVKSDCDKCTPDKIEKIMRLR